MKKYAIGLDFGTNSCRSLIVDIANGKEVASHVFRYPSGKEGVIVDAADPHLARQNPADYLEGIETIITGALKKAKSAAKNFSAVDVIGIGVDTTGSSPMPLDAHGQPLCFDKRFKKNPAAMAWLWKDHTSYNEAAWITETAAKIRPRYLSKIGGTYSSEWWWSKILHCRNTAPDVFAAAASWAEICDWITAHLTGNADPKTMTRSVCAAGHKAMFSDEWGGLPDEEFLNALSPGLGELRSRLFDTAKTSEKRAGVISAAWAKKLGLPADTAVCVGAFDAHMGAVGAGVSAGTLVKIIGTSTCDIMIHPATEAIRDIPGVCGIVNGSVMDGYYGIEAGQSAVGDIFLWFINTLVPDSYGKTQDEKFRNLEKEAMALLPGESGLLALDWNNGNRTILVDVRLTGLVMGQTLHTGAAEIYRALMEATAFGALTIIDRIGEYGVAVREVVNCGGLAVKSPLLMQIYADVAGRPMKISQSDQTPALGAAMFGAVAAGKLSGGYDAIEEAQQRMAGTRKVYLPIPAHQEVYKKLYVLYRQLHDSFGATQTNGGMHNVMKELLDLRDHVRKTKFDGTMKTKNSRRQ
jgi:L-ribulokinase